MTSIQKDFESLLEKAGIQEGFQCQKYLSSKRYTNNIVELSGKINCLFYLHIRSAEPYRWGITKTRIEELQSLNKRWFIILLYGKPEKGFFLTDNNVGRYIDEKLWPLGRNRNRNEYKVQPGKTLKYNQPFKTFEEFITSLKRELKVADK